MTNDQKAIRERILRLLRQANALNTTEVAMALNAHRDVIQTELHALDDDGLVIMRNGFYRIAEAARQEGGEA